MDRKIAVSTGVNDDGNSITLMMHDSNTGELLSFVSLETPEIEAIIEGLADHRAKLPDEVPRELDPGTRLKTIEDPIWRTKNIPETNSVLLALRHPGIGWIAAQMPKASARSLGEFLMKATED